MENTNTPAAQPAATTQTATPAQPAAPAPAPAPVAAAPAATPAVNGMPKMPENLSEEDKKAWEEMVKNLKAAQEAAAKANVDEPWYWSKFSKGVYVGLTVAAVGVGAYVLYQKYVGSAE